MQRLLTDRDVLRHDHLQRRRLPAQARQRGPARARLRPASRRQRRFFFFSSRRRHTISVSAFLLNRSSDLYQQKESTARVASIMENTNLSKQQRVSEIMRQKLTQAQTAGQYFTNDRIKEMTRKVSAEVDLVQQQTQNQRYGSSHIGATAKDISNVVTDAASGVVDIFHGIDKAVADTWNTFWKDGKADGIGSNLSRK